MGKELVIMTTENPEKTIENENTTPEKVTPTELDLLKERAKTMGLAFHVNIGVDKLKAKIDEHLNGPVESLTPEQTDAALNGIDVPTAMKEAKVVESQGQRRVRLRKKAQRLVRVRITNMNPIKGNLKGEILSVGNAAIGSIKRFIPYNADKGWHVPQILLTQLQNRKYMSHYEIKVGNRKVKKHKLIPEFAIEILPPLTGKELQELARKQAMSAGEL